MRPSIDSALRVYNTLTHREELFQAINPPYVGLYVCGPTVYGPSHLGHARCYITFDVIQRYLKHLGYKVRYVRNITDVGHLERDADEGTDKIVKQALLEHVEPMEVVQRYMNSYHHDMALLNIEPPNIEPQASGHISEQIATIQTLVDKKWAYVVNSSVYFDITAYQQHASYGALSGRKIEDMLAGTRQLVGSNEKKFPLDFALWKRATPSHIMRWPSPWGWGFPGWHIECTALATKYLGPYFDIHGGGMDLLFPHHECEIAQSQAVQSTSLARYWLHNNLMMIEDQKMSKSLGNYITLSQLFEGTHPLLVKAYSPMVLRFFILQAHYRSTLNFSNEALQAAEQGYIRLMNGLRALARMAEQVPLSSYTDTDSPMAKELQTYVADCYKAMDDDFNTAQLLAALFQLLKWIHALEAGQIAWDALGKVGWKLLQETYTTFLVNILGIKEDYNGTTTDFVPILLKVYTQAKEQKNYQQVDFIRAALKPLGITLQDTSQGVIWNHVSL